MADSTRQSEQSNSTADRKAKAQERSRRYREKHPDAGREYYLANREKILAACKEYRSRTKEKKRASDKAYYEANKEKIAAWSKSPAGRAVQQRSRKKNKDKLREKHREWREKNRQHLRAYKRARRQRHPHLRLINRIRCRTWGALKTASARKKSSTIELVGCTAFELAAWIESQFTDGMSWEKIGDIHIDHVIPLAKFDLSDPEQQQAAFHYTNLRPMWGLENKQKSDKVPGQQLFAFAYSDMIQVGKKPRPSRQRTHGTRQHVDDKPCSV